jgi:hypothetical protein
MFLKKKLLINSDNLCRVPYPLNGTYSQGFGSGSVSGSGSVLDPYSIGPLDPDPDP